MRPARTRTAKPTVMQEIETALRKNPKVGWLLAETPMQLEVTDNHVKGFLRFKEDLSVPCQPLEREFYASVKRACPPGWAVIHQFRTQQTASGVQIHFGGSGVSGLRDEILRGLDVPEHLVKGISVKMGGTTWKGRNVLCTRRGTAAVVRRLEKTRGVPPKTAARIRRLHALYSLASRVEREHKVNIYNL